MNFKEYIDKTDPELLKQGYQEWLQDASLMDDIFFRKCAEYRPDIVKTIIRVTIPILRSRTYILKKGGRENEYI